VEDLIEHPDKRKQIGEKAFEFAKSKLDISTIGIEYQNYICNNIYYALSENIIREFVEKEIVGKQYTAKEIDSIIETLCYVVE
jgi:hypothetical protein